VKFHFKTMQGHKFWTNAEAEAVVAKDRESAQPDLFTAIERRDFPRWRFCVQVMPEGDAEKTAYNPFDLTKVWPHRVIEAMCAMPGSASAAAAFSAWARASRIASA